MIQEPVAAGVYKLEEDKEFYDNKVRNEGGYYEETYLIVDIGGGTSDVSKMILSGMESDDEDKNISYSFQIQAIGGVDQLGGRDIDILIGKVISKKLVSAIGKEKYYKDYYSLNKEKKDDFKQLILDQAERLKCKLSLEVNVDTIIRLPWGGTQIIEISRSELKPLINKLFTEFKDEIMKCMGTDTITKVYYVGGTSSSKMVKDCLDPLFKADTIIETSMRNRDAVVKGAAILSYIVHTNSNRIVFNNVAGYRIGIRVWGDNFDVLCQANQALPYSNVKTGYYNKLPTDKLEIRLIEGPYQKASKCTFIASCVLDFSKNKKRDTSSNEHKGMEDKPIIFAAGTLKMDIEININERGKLKLKCYESDNKDNVGYINEDLILCYNQQNDKLLQELRKTEEMEEKTQQLNIYKDEYYGLINEWESQFSMDEMDLFKSFCVRNSTLKSMQLYLAVLNKCIVGIKRNERLNIKELKEYLIVDLDSDDDNITDSSQTTTDNKSIIKRIKLVNKAKSM